MKNQPPKRAIKFLRWFCREDYIEEIEGDLTELFENKYEQASRRANWIFFWWVLRYFRPDFIKAFDLSNRTNYTAMFRHNFLITYRTFKRYKTSFFINLIGLSTGIACALLIFLWVNDEVGMDKFHEQGDDIYHVMTNHHTDDGISTWKDSPIPLAPALAAEMPEIETAINATEVSSSFVLSVAEKNLSARGRFVDSNYFKVFSFDWAQGDKNQVLTDKRAIVISERMALNLFNTTQNIVGKTIDWQYDGKTQPYAISGIFRDIPSHSSEPFDFAVSFDVYKDDIGDGAHWGNHHARTYLLMKPGVDLEAFSQKIEGFIGTKSEGSNVTLYVQRFSDGYLYNQYDNGQAAGGRIEYVRLFSIIALFILMIACINFMNLSTAKASRRIKEIGIKKTIGARRKTLIAQYLGESLLMAFLALFAGLLLIDVILPQFNEITGKELSLVFDTQMIASFLAITVITGLIAGSYPALYLSGFNPAIILKGKLNSSVGEVWMRKGLVVLQFALSVILIVSVWVVYQQIEYVQNKNLGYDQENVVYFNIEGKVSGHLETTLSEIRQVPGVTHASSMWGSFVDRTATTEGYFNWEGKDPESVISFSFLGINHEMLELVGIGMKEGRTFSRDFPSDTSAIILNEAAIAVMGLKDPIGKTFNLWGDDLKIIGVTNNFHFQSLHESIQPIFFKLTPTEASRIMVKIKQGTEKATLENLQEFYEAYNPGFAFDYRFLDTDYQAQYVAEQRVSTLSRYFAGLAILISCLGLFGLAAFTAERRVKEIGIRKILGSSVWGIVSLLSTDFTKMVLMAVLIALPLGYFIANYWLGGFAYKIDLEWWYFAGAALIALAIAWFTVLLQIAKVAQVNPAECLRDE